MRDDTPSQTARLIALATVYAAVEGIEPVPSEEAVRLCFGFLSDSRYGDALLRALGSRTARRVVRLVEWAMAPGIVQHFMRRKAWIEEQWRTAATLGFERLVTIAAGFDTLGLRAAAEPGGPISIEIDHPATQAAKRANLADGAPPRAHFIGADLSESSILGLLTAPGVPGADRPTFVIVEGLLMYLDPDAAPRLVREVAALPVPRLRAVFTFMERSPGRPISFWPRRRLADRWLRRHGEPFTWGATRDEFRQLLADADLRTLEMVGERDLAARWTGPVLEGEILVLAER